MKKNISINLQGIIFHIEDDAYEVLSRYLQEVKAHFISYQGHDEIVADIEGRIAELFAARLTPAKQVITLLDVQEMTAKMGRVSDFASADDEDDESAATASAHGSQSAGFGQPGSPPPFGTGTGASTTADDQPRRLYRDLAHRKIAGVCAGLAQYFMVNPLVVRLVFLAALLLPNSFLFIGRGPFHFRDNFGLGSLAFIAYVVLWIALPKRYDAPEPIDTLSTTGPLAGRKLFRDTDAGKIGGVSAGLAAYFNIDVTLVRVLFLLLLFAGGSGFAIYLVLWIVMPEARTVSEKMQMRGDAVTLSGIDSELRAGGTYDPNAPGAGSRPVGTFFENAAREAKPAFSFVGRVLGVVAGVLLLILGTVLLVGFSMALGTALGLLPQDTVELGDAGTKYHLLHDVPTWGLVSGFLAFAVPALALLLLGFRLLLRRRVLNQGGGLLLLGLWLLGVVGTTAAVAQYTQNYRTRASYVTSHDLEPSYGKGLVLAVRDQGEYLRDVRLRIVPADTTAFGGVEQEFTARGRTQQAARLTAQSTVLYHYAQQDSTLTLDRGIELKENAPFRNQQLTLTLHLPLGKTYTLTPAFIRLLDDDDFTTRRRPNDSEPFRARLTRQGRFVCLRCPDTDESTSSRDDEEGGDDGDEVVKFDVNGNRMRVRVNTDGDTPHVSVETDAADVNPDPAHYGTGRKTLSDAGEFTQIDASGVLQVVVRAGSEYKVEAAGSPENLRRLTLSRNGNRLRVRREGTFNLFGDNDGDNQNQVLVTITLPRLEQLELHGASEAIVSGFTQREDLRLEVRDASSLRLSDVQLAALTLTLNGASRADLSGRAERLDLEAHSASQVVARDLPTAQVKLDLEGASTATVNATETLDVDAQGASTVQYLGNPRLNQDLSGASSLEPVR